MSRVTGLSYETCHAAFTAEGRKWLQGTPNAITRRVLERLGFRVTHEWSTRTLQAAIGIRVPLTTASFVDHQRAWRSAGLGDMLVHCEAHIAAYVHGLLRDWSESEALPIHGAWTVARAGASVEPPDIIYL